MHDIYKLSPPVVEIIKPLAQIELEQVNFYMQLGAIANGLGFLGAEQYFYNESNEEKEHYMGWQNYLLGRGNEVIVPMVDEQPMIKVKSLYELTEKALAMEASVSTMYQNAATQAFGLCQMTYRKIQEYILIQQEALAFYIDACTTLAKLDKGGELVAEKKIFKV